MAHVKVLTHPRAMPLVLCASVLVLFGFWRWAELILAPANGAIVLAAKRPIGNNSDLYARWLGARELLLRGRDPYSPELTREIQTGFYGRPLDPGNPQDPVAQESFVYPLYVVFLMAPTITLPFDVVKEIFRWLLLGAIACSVPLWMYALRFAPSRLVTFSIILLAVSSYPAVEEYFQQNLTALVLLFLAAAAAAVVRKWLVLSGVLLALATAKPDTVGLLVLWFLLWGLAKWKERSSLIWGFVGGLTALIGGAELISPHWFGRFLSEVLRYRTYGTDPSMVSALLPSRLAMLVTLALLLALFGVCWKWRRAAATSEHFGWALAYIGTVTLMVIPKLAAYNQLLLIPALLMLARSTRTGTFMPRALTKAAFACQVWQWLGAVALSMVAYAVPANRLQSVALVPLYTLLALPPLTFIAVAAHTAGFWGPNAEPFAE